MGRNALRNPPLSFRKLSPFSHSYHIKPSIFRTPAVLAQPASTPFKRSMASQLEPLPEAERLSSRCIRILGGNPGKFTLQGTNTYLLGTGSKRLLIDAAQGMPSWKTTVQKILQEEHAVIERCLITHWHPDHTKGIDDLLAFSPSTVIHKNEPFEGQADIKDGQIFSVQGVNLTAIHSPGHTTDHMAFWLEEEDALFTGDNVLGQGTSVFEDLSIYLDSLRKMENRFSGRAYPGHGPVISDGPSRISEYIAHRKQREDQVLQVLQSPRLDNKNKDNGWSSMEIVKIVYQEVREELYQAAEKSIIHILDKLEKEEKVLRREKDNRWVLLPRPAL